MAIQRGYLGTPSRQLHFRRAGAEGPWLALLHETPVSSLQMEPLLASLAPWAQAVAWDTPGYGLSDPLPDSPTIDDYALALGRTMRQVTGGASFAVCGTHTGASIAIAMAAAFPEVSALVLTGIPLYSRSEAAARLSSWAPPCRPEPTGTYLGWAWQRITNSWPDATAEEQHLRFVSFVSCLPRYHLAYEAVFADDTRRRLEDLTVPVLAVTSRDDPLKEATARAGAHYHFPAVTLDVTGPLLQSAPQLVAEEIRRFIHPPASPHPDGETS